MNVYVAIRTILHALLFLVNLLALTVGSGMIAVSKGQGHKATAGSVLVIIGFIFYAFIFISMWSETFFQRSKFSKNRTEAIVLPLLFFFQLVAAIVTTTETSRGVCVYQSFCVALLVLSWMSTVTLLVYYMIAMIVIFHHYTINNEIWDESALSYNWFPMSTSKSALPPQDLIANPPREITRLPSVDSEIASIEPPPPRLIGQHRRQRSSWMPPPLNPESKMTDLSGDGPASRAEASAGDGTAEIFVDIPLDPEPSLEEEGGSSRLSFGLPRWAKKLRRGVDAPFPLTSARTANRGPA